MLTVNATVNGTWFPVMLYNGQELVSTGMVKITATDNYASFNSTISQLINAHPDNLILYIMETAVPGSNSPSQYKYKSTISHWTDFSVISKQKDCRFVVIVRWRKVSDHQNPVIVFGDIDWQELKKKLMRKNMFNAKFSESEIQIKEEQQEKQSPRVITQSGVCEECSDATGVDEFHFCKIDAIVVNGYKTNFGPIGPQKIEPGNEQDGFYSLFGPRKIEPENEQNGLQSVRSDAG